MTDAETEPSAKPGSRLTPIILSVLALAVFALLVGLGTWQVQRLSWKLDLIARVDARIHAPAVAPPGQAAWNTITAADDEYRKVTATGTFANDRETLVYAVTTLGPGYWVMTPLLRADGVTILVNRGFVPADRRDGSERRQANLSTQTTVTGLLRMSEPKGGFLRSNDPSTDKWYSRDVSAIAAARQLETVAPYFIDADASPNPGGLPVGGLTVVQFKNDHLVYAITWYALALMLAAGVIIVIRRERRLRRGTQA